MKTGHAIEPSSEPLRLARWIEALDRYGEQSALIAFDKDGAQRTSYAELDALSGRFATGLMERGIGRGDRLALLAPSSLEWITAFLGTIRAGATPVPLDVQFDDDALLHVLDDSRPRRADDGRVFPGRSPSGCVAVDRQYLPLLPSSGSCFRG